MTTTNKIFNLNETPDFSVIYNVPKTMLTINDDLRKINEKDQKLMTLLESVKKNGIIQPITVWYTVKKTVDKEGVETGEEKIVRIVTGNRRVWCSKKVEKIETVPCQFVKCQDESDYMRMAYHTNVSKASTVGELCGVIKKDVVELGYSARKVAGIYGISEKSVYDSLKIAGNEVLMSVAKKNFKNAMALKKGGSSMLDNPEIIKIAKTGTLDELKKALKVERDRVKALKMAESGVVAVEVEIKEIDNERLKMFALQLPNFNGLTIETNKLKAFLWGEDISTWMNNG